MKGMIRRLPDSRGKRDVTTSDMDLRRIIDLNMDLAPKAPTAISVASSFLGAAIGIQLFRTSTVGLIICLIIVVWTLAYSVIPLNHVFSRSLFGEEAYRYMLLPISFRKMVVSKICVGVEHCCIFCILALLYAYCVLIKFFGAGGVYSSVVEGTATGIINLHHMISDGVMTTGSVVFLMGASPVAALIESAFISAMILCGVIIYNLFDPRREKPQAAIGIAIAGFLIYLAANFLFIWAPGLFFKNDLAIPQLIIAAGLKLGAIYGLARGAAHMLEEKYALN